VKEKENELTEKELKHDEFDKKDFHNFAELLKEKGRQITQREQDLPKEKEILEMKKTRLQKRVIDLKSKENELSTLQQNFHKGKQPLKSVQSFFAKKEKIF
jgi:uncharacterized protein (DUF3084 family)